jgi:hypothetical protein
LETVSLPSEADHRFVEQQAGEKVRARMSDLVGVSSMSPGELGPRLGETNSNVSLAVTNHDS